MENERKIASPKRGDDDLFIQPKKSGPDRERDEQHNRDRFAAHFNYADPVTGNVRTFDKQGDYNCGRCNQSEGKECLLLDIKSVDLEAGSCGDWEIICVGDGEMELHRKDPDVASYGVAENGKGFGCHRCPYASKAFEPDSRERDLYCGMGDFRVFSNACCSLNGAELVKDKGKKEYQKLYD